MRTLDALSMLGTWSARRFGTVFGVAMISILVVGIPTDLIDTPFFGREIPPTWWSWPALIISSVLTGLLVATYVRADTPDDEAIINSERAAKRNGTIGGVLTFFAVGCPVCNKLVLIALGSAGAITWFEPVQPFLQVLAVGLLTWALVKRLEGERSCPVTV